jgi:hypothetical protein
MKYQIRYILSKGLTLIVNLAESVFGKVFRLSASLSGPLSAPIAASCFILYCKPLKLFFQIIRKH